MKRSILIICACFVVGLVSGYLIHSEMIKRDLRREFATRCPPGFVEWDNRRFLPMDKVDGNWEFLPAFLLADAVEASAFFDDGVRV